MLDDKVVAITGASSGIGAAISRRFAERGAHVLMMARSEQKLKRLASEIGGMTNTYRLDVTDARHVHDVFTTVGERYGKIDILINNAGVGYFKLFAETSDAEVKQMMDINYFGILHTVRAVLPIMEANGSGHLIHIGSLGGKVATAKSAAYAATKHAVLGFTAALRQELRGTGIIVSAVNPGPVRTPFFEQADPSGNYLRNLPSWFVLDAKTVANAVLKVAISGRREYNLPWIAAWGAKLYSLFPGWSERLARNWLNRK